MSKPIAVFVADAHFLVRAGLRQLFAQEGDIKIVGEAENAEMLAEKLVNVRPDVVIIDPTQQGFFSIDSIALIHKISPRAGILVISADHSRNSVYRVLELGVSCFLTKTCDAREIFDGVTSAAQHERFFCKKVLNYIWEKSFGKVDDCNGIPLSQREIEILQLVVRGKIAKEIAHDLNLSTHTVYTHRKNILRKLNIATTPDLVLYAINHGLVDAPSLQS